MNETLFISDLHLSSECIPTVKHFQHFVIQRAKQATALYILGDLFDVWIGDDDDTTPIPSIIAALRATSDSGTKLFIQRGNRDFLIGRKFAIATGCQLLADCTKIHLYGIPTLLMHGDLLCTDDVAYQRFRRIIRNPLLIQLFKLRSLQSRRNQAAAYRAKSGVAIATKSVTIMDVNKATVENYMRRFKVQQLIHGHTHLPGYHDFFIDAMPAKRWVLADWNTTRASFLCATSMGTQICPIF